MDLSVAENDCSGDEGVFPDFAEKLGGEFLLVGHGLSLWDIGIDGGYNGIITTYKDLKRPFHGRMLC